VDTGLEHWLEERDVEVTTPCRESVAGTADEPIMDA